MAAFVACTKLENGSGDSASGSIGTPGAGNALLAAMEDYGATSVTVSDGHNTWTTAGTGHGTTDVNENLGFASAPSVTAVATTVTVTWSGGTNIGTTDYIYEFSGMATASMLDVLGTAKDNPATQNVSTNALTNTNANDVFLAVAMMGGSATSGITSTGTGWSMPANGVEQDGAAFIGGASGYKIVSTIASQTESWSQTAAAVDCAAFIVCYKAAAAAGQTPYQPWQQRAPILAQ